MASAALLAVCVLAVLAVSNGLPNPLIQSATNEEYSTQSNSHNENSYTVVDNEFGPDYIASDSSSSQSSQSNYEYDSSYLNTDGGLGYGDSFIQQEQEIQQQASSTFQQQQQQQQYITI